MRYRYIFERAEKRALKPGAATSAEQHAHIFGQLRVERPEEIALGDVARQLEARDLPERVHARIGAACSGHRDVLPLDGRQRSLELGLHRPRIGLPLKAGKVGAVITERSL